jgi:hypothetical protein
MEMKEVSSSQIHSVGHDPETNTLRIRFKDRTHKNGVIVPGSTYEYDGVPAEVHAGLLAAESVGAHFGTHIRNGGFAYRKIEVKE